ncbi:putative family II 2-keto-3-deoxy-D-arabino-heptulosonate aldolase [Filobasidium floriforme]|uniref:putative family II 2-keto-3-deoxy-D-arabino-heptulosonate aldolase n=1 Tax=Filobasidium floriforme TaxID=5210 RepID=UPI001E8E76ED|nr:putative family II 2-keto-3-deoxy-D-arabino-heptulosonate aldolase [Filobasidium floriforme]KAH8085811.1 putative family II 2-keto-3-deoxy-D-arabino-heptulosonate aldolase [Filobasidium floriforme]
MATLNWTPDSWRSKPIAQDVIYDDTEHLDKVLKKLRQLPPLVTPNEIDRLRTQLADVAQGKAFLLQGGDCAELFEACSQDPIEHKLSLILLMSLIILHGSRLPVIRIARIAGQYAKPRSKPTEVVDYPTADGKTEKKEVMSFRGDNVNGFDVTDRKADPERLLGAYFHSASTLNYIRALLSSGFADLHQPRNWSFSHVHSPQLQKAFEEVIDSLMDSLDFMRSATGGSNPGGSRGGTETVDFYTSHEGLSLEYEEALTRGPRTDVRPESSGSLSRSNSLLPRNRRSSANARSDASSSPKKFYNLSSHFIWIGDRTRQLDGAHVEYFRGIQNPIGIKIGPTMKPEELVQLLDVVNPDNIPGKVTLISRYGADKIEKFLPAHIEAVKATRHIVVWQCDAMHGNTKSSETDPSLKTRHFVDIIQEISTSMRIHKEQGTILGGVHLELTGEVNDDGFSVTECIGGSMELEDKDLSFNYRSHCDPRLNYEQSLDVAFLVADNLKAKRRGTEPKDILLAELRGRSSTRA